MTVEQALNIIRQDVEKQARYIARAFPGDDFNSKTVRAYYGADYVTDKKEGANNEKL